MKFVEYQLDKVRKFRISLMSMSRIEKKFGKPFAKIDHPNLMMEDFVYLMWACLSQEDRNEIKESSDLMNLIDDHSDVKTMYQVFTEIINEGFGQVEKNEETVPEVEEEEATGTGEMPVRTLSDVG